MTSRFHSFFILLIGCFVGISISSANTTFDAEGVAVPDLNKLKVMKCHGSSTDSSHVSRVSVPCGNFLKPSQGDSLNWLCPSESVIIGFGSIDSGSWQKCNCDWYGCSTCWTPSQSCFIQCSPSPSATTNCNWE